MLKEDYIRQLSRIEAIEDVLRVLVENPGLPPGAKDVLLGSIDIAKLIWEELDHGAKKIPQVVQRNGQ